MESGIWRDDEGFQIMVDGVDRVFSDEYDGALALARNLKRTNRQSRIEDTHPPRRVKARDA